MDRGDMKRKISWTLRCDDGVKREVRVELSHGSMKWQFKRADEERWDYDTPATAADWDMLETIIEHRQGRGRALNFKPVVARFRSMAGV